MAFTRNTAFTINDSRDRRLAGLMDTQCIMASIFLNDFYLWIMLLGRRNVPLYTFSIHIHVSKA